MTRFLTVLFVAVIFVACGSSVSESSDTNLNNADVGEETDTIGGQSTMDVGKENCGPMGCESGYEDTQAENCGPMGCGAGYEDTTDSEVKADETEVVPPTGCVANSECDDETECTQDFCVSGSCMHENVPEGALCAVGGHSGKCDAGWCWNDTVEGFCYDGDPCTDDATDGQGACVHQTNICSDGNFCTKDVCLPVATGLSNHTCTHELIPGCTMCGQDSDCDDGNPCTSGFVVTGSKAGDQCVNGQCVSLPVPDYGQCGADGSSLYCYQGVCKDFHCDDSDACTLDFVDSNTGKCVHLLKESCAPVVECHVDAECFDTDGCTKDTCVDYVCYHTAIDDCQSCTTNNQCVKNAKVCSEMTATKLFTLSGNCVSGSCEMTWEHCQNGCHNGACQGECSTNSDCNDNNLCSDDTCDNGVCVYTQKAICQKCDMLADCVGQNVCQDNKLFTVNGDCTNGLCEYHAATVCAKGCEAGACRQCTVNADCDDDNACTGDACVAGQCQYAAIANCAYDPKVCQDDSDCVGQLYGTYCGFDATSGKKICQSCEPATGAEVIDPGCNSTHRSCLYADYTAASGVTYGRAFCGDCVAHADCNDSDSCTVDTCQVLGESIFGYGTTCVNTVNSQCQLCAKDTDCNDNKATTYDHCVGGTCSFSSSCSNDADCGLLTCVSGSCQPAPNVVTCQVTCPAAYPKFVAWYGQNTKYLLNGTSFSMPINDMCSWASDIPIFEFNCTDQATVWADGDKATLECSYHAINLPHPTEGQYGKRRVTMDTLQCP